MELKIVDYVLYIIYQHLNKNSFANSIHGYIIVGYDNLPFLKKNFLTESI